MRLPFMVIATQVPYGEAGTYQLTSVQIDRFAYKISIGYPESEDEIEVISRIDSIEQANTDPALTPREITWLVEQARNVYVHRRVQRYIVDLVSRMRGIRHVRWGPSPRASIWLLKGGRVRALMGRRGYVIPDDVKALAYKALQHRVELTSRAEAEEISLRSLISEALEETPVPKGLEEEQE